ncbi:MAG: hypothetical protein EOO77_18585 [Oxalobacteraceae bacterium]|nr:MAG: hypothetical protein EOO77_18585 [Oxalobacteraceae bacterium]
MHLSPISANRPTTLDQLDAVIAKALNARDAAAAGNLFDSNEGFALVNAMHDLTGCDDLYVLASDIQHDIAPEPSADFMLQAMLFSAAPRSGAAL